MKKIVGFMKKEPVFCVAFVLAVITAFLVPPSKAYMDYIDWRVLGILLSLMIVMKGFQKEGLFEKIANGLLKRVKSFRSLAAVLIMLCFFTSMLITNDVALITFVPFTIQVLSKIGKKNKMIAIIVMQTIAANLGSMLTPIGNPQNLYIYGLSGVSVGSMISWMLPYSGLSLLLLCIYLLFIPKDEIVMDGLGDGSESVDEERNAGKTSSKDGSTWKILAYAGLFLICLCTVLRFEFMPWGLSLGIVLLVFALVDIKVIPKADYMLLATFIAFFVFIGNMGNIESIHNMLAKMIDQHELLLGVVSSQVVSNVPASLLLSGFTNNYQALLTGVNLGGLGTLIASMASLISYKLYAQCDDKGEGTQMKYLLYFTVANVIFLVILVLEAFLIS